MLESVRKAKSDPGKAEGRLLNIIKRAALRENLVLIYVIHPARAALINP
ncbi:MAG: hypothetical protein LM590_16815 [Thermofilum sp.]|jgi:hypothetical protein|nr:hypothetical protein [Thermofilum sp.]